MVKQALIACAALFLGSSAFSQTDFCSPYETTPRYMNAVGVVAKNLAYSKDELCRLDRLADIYVTTRVIYNAATNQDEPHIWVTLHYNEYSCQYFVREADNVVTRKNCYNTF